MRAGNSEHWLKAKRRQERKERLRYTFWNILGFVLGSLLLIWYVELLVNA